jgi:hypothetical protein
MPLTYLSSHPGQQLLWTEQSTPENLDSIVWPRAASSAEVPALQYLVAYDLLCF